MLTLMLALACDPAAQDDLADLPLDAAAAPIAPYFLILGATATDQGEAVRLTARGATPGSPVSFLYSGAQGHGPCPTVLNGWCIQLLGPINTIATVNANAQGVASATFVMPTVMLGQTVHIQAIQATPTPKLSDVEARTIRVNGATAPFRVYNASMGPDLGFSYPGFLNFHPVDINEFVHLSALGLDRSQAWQPTPSAVVGLYRDNGNNEPGDLMIDSGTFVLSGAGAHEVPMPPLDIPPGRYWVAYTVSGLTETWANAWLTGHEALLPHTWGTPLPATGAGATFYWSPRHSATMTVF